jgi:hypothetical protein
MSSSEIRTTFLIRSLWTRKTITLVLNLTLISLMTLSSCTEDKWAVDVSKVSLPSDFSVRNFNREIQNLSENDSSSLIQLRNNYNLFLTDYCENILKIGSSQSSETVDKIRSFVAHPDTKETLLAIDSTSGNAEFLRKVSLNLENGFKRLHVFMPEEIIPEVIWMNSGFNFAIYPRDEFVAVGLEWFLGPEHSILKLLPPDRFPQYQQLRMHPDLMAADAMKGWMLVHFVNRGYTGEKCIDDVLYWGKVLWLLGKCMPEQYEHVLMDWTPEDLEWAQANETAIWLELQPANVLFETNRTVFHRWLTDGPFTKFGSIPQESPDRLGVWMGLKIVGNYMEQNPEISVEQLFSEIDYIPFLKSYRPER